MLTNRFSFLSLVPEGVLAGLLLDGPDVRVRLRMVFKEPNTLELTTTPYSPIEDLAKACTARLHGRPPMVPDVRYEAEVDEKCQVTMRVGGEIVKSSLAIEYVLSAVYPLLMMRARKYVDDLVAMSKVLSVTGARVCLRGTLMEHFTQYEYSRQIATLGNRQPRVRAFCLGCLYRAVGEPFDVHALSHGGKNPVALATFKDKRKALVAIEGLIGQPLSMDVLLMGSVTSYQAMFPGAQICLYEAGMQTVLREEHDTVLAQYLTKNLHGKAPQA